MTGPNRPTRTGSAIPKENQMKKRAMLLVMTALGVVLTFGGLTVPTAQAAGDVPCGTPGRAAYDETITHAARPAETHVVHHQAVDAVTHVVHHDGTPAVTHVEYLWSNPPGQGNDDNPGNGDEGGREERWLPAGVDPPGNNKPGTPGAWVKVDERTVVDVPAIPGYDETITDRPAVPGYDETVVDKPARDAYEETVHHAAIPAGDPCTGDPEPCADDSMDADCNPVTVPPEQPNPPVTGTPVAGPRTPVATIQRDARQTVTLDTATTKVTAKAHRAKAKAHRKAAAKVLPNTGVNDHLWSLAGVGLLLIAAGGALTGRRTVGSRR